MLTPRLDDTDLRQRHRTGLRHRKQTARALAGIGNSRRSINKDAVGVPVVTIGVPTVVDSSTLVWDALDAAGVDTSSMPDSLREVLTSGRRFYVAPNDSDVLTEEMSTIIAEAINVMCRAV